MSSCSLASTVLAWLQKELSIYSELLLISPIRDLTIEYWQGKPLLCLTHHYFPEVITNLIEQLQEQSVHSLTTNCIQIIQERLGVTITQEQENWNIYFSQIQLAIKEKQLVTEDTTLRDLHIGSTLPKENIENYVVQVLLPLNKLFHQLVDLSIREEEGLSVSTRSPSPRINTCVEELLTNDLPIMNRQLDDLPTLEEIQSALTTIESRDLLQFYEYLATLSSSLKSHPDLAVRISAIDATYAALHLQLHKGDILRTTIQFTNTAAYIRNELEFIQAKMLKTTTTDIGIQDLETRSKAAGVAIENLSIKFKSLFKTDTVTEQEYMFLREKYNLICCWVDEVRVWFVEAERIRIWIEERIQSLENMPNINALDEVELDYEILSIETLNSNQQILEKQVESFDKEDMTRLRAHVKALTGGNKDLSPADTTTIEITFTTLMTLDRLMHLLRRHSYELQMLTLRMYWEQEYDISVTWVRSTGEDVRLFVQQKARWRPPPLVIPNDTSDELKAKEKSEIINTLIDFEKKSSAFDQGQFTATVNMYQDLDDACNIELPSHLESRQVAIEEAFEELTNRIAFARQVVEQYLVVTDFLERADKLKNDGDHLRQEITIATEKYGTLPFHNSDFSEKVSSFQENAVRLVTSVASRVPYPEATHPTDEQGNDEANENIRMVIGARKSALVLFGEALDHSLASYRRALQLQKRAKQLQDEILRLLGWIDERMRSIKKSKVDVFVGKCALDETDLSRLNKERDGQVAKLNGIKENDIKKLLENIQALQVSSSQPPTNAHMTTLVSLLDEGMAGLGDQLVVLEDALQVHSLCLDVLGKRISWETQHAKTFLWISNMTFQVWEFVSRKAQWRPDMEVLLDRSIVQQEFELIQNKVQEFYSDQLTCVDQTFKDLSNGFNLILNSAFDVSQSQDNITPEHVQRRQDTLDQSYHNLCDLTEFTKGVLDQYNSLTNFSNQVITLGDQGRGIIADIQAANDTVMKLSDADARREEFVTLVKEFSQNVIQLWMQLGSQLPYPQCPEDARSTRPSTCDDEISTEVATIIFKNYTELQDLVKKMTDLLQRLDISIVYRLKLEQWCTDSDEFDVKVKSLTETVDTMYTFDLNTGLVLDGTDIVPIETYVAQVSMFQDQVLQLETEKYQPLLVSLKDLKQAVEGDDQVKSVVDPSVTQATMMSLDVSWNDLNSRVEAFKSQATACNHRAVWENLWNDHYHQINMIQDQVREWINEKNVWLASPSQGDLDALISRIQASDATLHTLGQNAVPPLKSAFTNMMTLYKSSDLIYTTSLETKQDELEKLSIKLQDMILIQVSEIQFLKARHGWESNVDRELKNCLEKAVETEAYIRQYARWSPSSSPDHVERESADTQVAALSALLDDLSHLQTENAALLQTEMIYKRKSALESAIERVQEHVKFVDQVVQQRDMIVARLEKVSQLETLAESIKAHFLSSDTMDGKEQEVLQDYFARVAQLESTMLYPVRHYRDHDATCRQEDDSHNAVMADMLLARRSRLDELGTSLESILKSKERLSRCKAAEETYMTEANTVKEWIETKTMQLNSIEPSLAIEELRKAVTTVGALQSGAVTYASSVQSLKESANQCVVMIQQQGDDENILARIQSTQLNINAAWDDLVNKIQVSKISLSTTLRYRDYVKCVESFNEQCKLLQSNVMEMDLSHVTEDITNQWQNNSVMLNDTSIEHIRTRLGEEKAKSEEECVSKDVLKEMTEMLAVVLQQFDTFKKLVSEKTTAANHYRFKKEYFVGADAVDTCMTETRSALDGISHRIIRGISVQEDTLVVNQVNASYQALCDLFEKHHEAYDEQRSFYRFLQLNKVSDLTEVDTRQHVLEQRWKQLKQDISNDKQHVDSVSQWFDLHGKLNEMQSESLAGIFTRLENMVLEDSMPSFLDQDASLLKTVESRLSSCWDIASNLSDDGNLICFQTRHDELQEELKRATALFNEKKAQAQKHVDFVACQNALQELETHSQELIQDVNQRLQEFVIEDHSSKYIEQLFRSCSMSTTEAQQKKIVAQSVAINGLIVVLQSKYADDNERIDAIKADLERSMGELNKTCEEEHATHDMIRRVLGHCKSAENIATWIESCNSATTQILGDHLDESEAALELASLSQKLDDFENVIDSFKELSETLLEVQGNHVVHKLVDIVETNTKSIEEKWLAVQEELKIVEETVQKTVRGIAIARKMKNIMAIVGETREYVTAVKLFDSDDTFSVHTHDDDSQAYIGSDMGDTPISDDDKTAIGGEDNSLDGQQPILSMLRKTEVENIELNLSLMESEIKPQIELEVEQLNTMISEFKDIDNTFIRQHQEVQEAVASLFQLLETKYTELEKAMDIGKYLAIADEIEILQGAFEEAVSKSAPHHATLIGSSFSRTDLQARSIELDSKFRYYEEKIVQQMTEAKKQSSIITEKQEPESALVATHFKEMEQKWVTIKKQFKTRKIELSRTIDTSVDPNDKLTRSRKCSLPTRKTSSILRERADSSMSRQRLSPTASSSSSSSKSGISRLHPNRSTGRYLTPPLQHQPSKSATHVKQNTPRIVAAKPPLNSYVADPDNDLDIEIGRIVNETPYRVKVKMVPGEVGRYWFGNLNPKLAYCRVLKSKMVMVRVGGGWTELSQFLRDHALLEGDFIPRSQRNNNRTRMIPEEEEPKSPTIQEGFIETRRDFGKQQHQHHQHHHQQQRSVSPQNRSSTTTNSSRSSTSNHPTGSPSHSASTNTTSGYKEGDRFIAVDQHGNQLEVKMRKVMDIGRNMSSTTANTNDYTRRRIARRKDKSASSSTVTSTPKPSPTPIVKPLVATPTPSKATPTPTKVTTPTPTKATTLTPTKLATPTPSKATPTPTKATMLSATKATTPPPIKPTTAGKANPNASITKPHSPVPTTKNTNTPIKPNNSKNTTP